MSASWPSFSELGFEVSRESSSSSAAGVQISFVECVCWYSVAGLIFFLFQSGSRRALLQTSRAGVAVMLRSTRCNYSSRVW